MNVFPFLLASSFFGAALPICAENFPSSWVFAATGVREELVVRSQSMRAGRPSKGWQGQVGGVNDAKRPAQAGWRETLEEDNDIGWGKNGCECVHGAAPWLLHCAFFSLSLHFNLSPKKRFDVSDPPCVCPQIFPTNRRRSNSAEECL